MLGTPEVSETPGRILSVNILGKEGMGRHRVTLI